MEILRINATETYPIRHQMLRPSFSYEECHFAGDDDDQTFHLGVRIDNKFVSIASFYYERHPGLCGEHHYRLRGLSTLPSYQKQGLSYALLETAFPIIRQNMCTLVWCNARVSAIGFYEKLGLGKTGREFSIPGIGLHFLMYRELPEGNAFHNA